MSTVTKSSSRSSTQYTPLTVRMRIELLPVSPLRERNLPMQRAPLLAVLVVDLVVKICTGRTGCPYHQYLVTAYAQPPVRYPAQLVAVQLQVPVNTIEHDKIIPQTVHFYESYLHASSPRLMRCCAKMLPGSRILPHVPPVQPYPGQVSSPGCRQGCRRYPCTSMCRSLTCSSCRLSSPARSSCSRTSFGVNAASSEL